MKHLLERARQEIVSLRNRNAILEAQVAVVEVFAAVAGLRRNDGGIAPDVAWELQKAIDNLIETPVKE